MSKMDQLPKEIKCVIYGYIRSSVLEGLHKDLLNVTKEVKNGIESPLGIRKITRCFVCEKEWTIVYFGWFITQYEKMICNKCCNISKR